MKRSNSIKDSERPAPSRTRVSHSKKRFSLSLRNSTVKRRRCLMCGKAFFSRGPHNRRCKKCNQKIAQAGENAFYVPRMYSANYRSGEPLKESE